MDLAGRRKSQAVAPMMGLLAAKRMSKRWTSRIGRESMAGAGPAVVKLENTYRMEPKSKFEVKAAYDLMVELLEEKMSNRKYTANSASLVSKIITETLKSRLKSDLCFDRYRLVVHATVGEVKGQGISVSSRCMWNDNFDTSVTASYSNKSIFCVATVFAVCLE